MELEIAKISDGQFRRVTGCYKHYLPRKRVLPEKLITQTLRSKFFNNKFSNKKFWARIFYIMGNNVIWSHGYTKLEDCITKNDAVIAIGNEYREEFKNNSFGLDYYDFTSLLADLKSVEEIEAIFGNPNFEVYGFDTAYICDITDYDDHVIVFFAKYFKTHLMSFYFYDLIVAGKISLVEKIIKTYPEKFSMEGFLDQIFCRFFIHRDTMKIVKTLQHIKSIDQ